MKKKPLVSVVIPAFNSASSIIHTLEALKQQTFQDFEILVVNDGSTDQTELILKAYREQNVNVRIFSQNNQGPGSARNLGMQHALGDYIAFLDADDKLLPLSLALRVEAMQKYHFNLLFTDLFIKPHIDSSIGPILQQKKFLEKFQGAIQSQQGNILHFNKKYFDLSLIHYPFIYTCTVMIPRTILQQVGFFHNQWRGSEDIDYWLRIAKRGSVGFINLATAEYHQYLSNLTKKGQSRFYFDSIQCYKKLKTTLHQSCLKISVSHKIAHLAFAGGYELLDDNQLIKARDFFKEAWMQQPVQARFWMYWFLTFCPANIFKQLRRFKQKWLNP